MGMTLWLHRLEGQDYFKGSQDHSSMHRLSDELDDICAKEGVSKLSDFFDYSDLECHYGDETGNESGSEFDEEDDEVEDESSEDSELDPETGSGNEVEDMAWFDAEDGIRTMMVLRDAVEENQIPDLEPREHDDLLEELEDCLKRIEDTASRDGRFHLSVVE
jgi:hypothetical protein